MRSTNIQMCTLHGSYTRVLPGCKIHTWTKADHNKALQTSQVCSHNSAAAFGVTFRKIPQAWSHLFSIPASFYWLCISIFARSLPSRRPLGAALARTTSARVHAPLRAHEARPLWEGLRIVREMEFLPDEMCKKTRQQLSKHVKI